MYKLYIKTLGCQLNDYDSERISNLLKITHSYVKTDVLTEANLLILNTCSVREKAYFKVFSILGLWRSLKIKSGNKIIICVTGCVAQQMGYFLFKYAPFVDIILGTQSYSYFPEFLDNFLCNQKKQINIDTCAKDKFSCFTTNTEGRTGFVTIMEGCNKFCSYCIVPYTRGAEVSRPFDDIIVEIVTLVTFGVIEVVLLGQNVNAYAGDFYNGTFVDLAFLIETISFIKGVGRIKFLTSHPTNFKQNLINVFKNVNQLTNFLHLPIQSGSDYILKKMKRCYTNLDICILLRKLIQKRKCIKFSTDIIVGFPGETYYDFFKTYKILKDFVFDYSYSFLYSRRPGTDAEAMLDLTTRRVKKKRLLFLQDLIKRNVLIINKEMVGTLQRVVIVGFLFSSKNIVFGYTDNNRLVCFTIPFFSTHKVIVNVCITCTQTTLFFGFYVDEGV